jgi:hypothetical protein
MSRLYGSVRQMAFVVRDVEAAMRYWIDTLGVGPFFVLREIRPDAFRYRGASSPSPTLTIGFANSGEIQIELIQQHDEHPSAYRDFLASGRAGLQHVSSWLTRAEYDATYARMTAAGVVVAHEGAMAGGGVRFAYFATDAAFPGGPMYEIADVAEPQILPMMTMIADAARDWDGADPIREIRL